MMRRIGVLAALLATAGSAAAQSVPSPAGPAPSAPAPTVAPSSSPGAAAGAAPAAPGDPEAAARADYNDAFDALVAGDFGRAAVGFSSVAARTQDRDLAAAARELARLAQTYVERKAALTTGAAPAQVAPGPVEEKDEGRTSFIVLTTMYSLYVGEVIVDVTNISDFRAGIVTITGTTAAGLLGSLYGTRGKTMTGAMADSYSLGMLEGFVNAGLLVAPIGLTNSSEQVQITLALSGAAGGIAGLLYGYELKPTRGQVSFAGTLSLLGFASTGLSFGIFLPKSLNGDTALTMMAGGTDVGLAAGLALGRDLDWSVSRGRIVQLGSLLGGLAGLAAGALITGANSSTDDDTRIITGLTLAGIWGGFALSAVESRSMTPDPRYDPALTGGVHAQLAPMPLHGGGGLAIIGTF
jgi:hypothetical protein